MDDPKLNCPLQINFDKLVDLVVSCSVEDLKQFADRQEEMLPTHQQMLYLISLRQSVHGLMNKSFFTRHLSLALMANECTYVMTIEELSVFC